jgi:hypothetical protein
MKKEQLKKVLKPLVKECIKEVIFEEGVLSGIVSEVAQGLSGAQVISSKPIQKTNSASNNFQSEALISAKKSLEETKKSLQESIGIQGIFEGTSPIKSGGNPSGGSSGSRHGALRDMDPSDPGVNIDGIMKIAGGAWSQLK